MFLWQLPHFWLLLVKYKDEYEKGGFPVSKINQFQNLKWIIYLWVLQTSGMSLTASFMGIINYLPLIIFVFILNLWLIITFTRIAFNSHGEPDFRKHFTALIYLCLFLCCYCISGLYR